MSEQYTRNRRDCPRLFLIMAGLVSALLCLIFVSASVGSYTLPLSDIATIVCGAVTGGGANSVSTEAQVVLLMVRLPRIFLCVMVGGALAVSGAAYQGLFRNPMVSPDILGVSSGASVGAALGILWGLNTSLVHLLAFGCGITAVIVVMAVSRIAGRGDNLVVLILSGIVISTLFTGTVSFIKYVADSDQKLPEIVFWIMGSFARSGSYANVGILGAIMVAGVVPLYCVRWKINALTFGEEEAMALGVNVRQLRWLIIVSATLLTASAVCLCGVIGWVGLIIPHLARFMVGPSYGTLLPVSFVSGGIFMLAIDTFSRAFVPGELPVSILTSFIGAPLFLFILLRSRRSAQ